MIDLTPEAIKQRIETLKQIRKEAEEAWEIGDHEGDVNEKAYWIEGYVARMLHEQNNIKTNLIKK